MADLTDEAKREIAEAIRIVREDKFAQYVRTTLGNHVAKPPGTSPQNEPPKPPEIPPGPTPPPQNEPPTPPEPTKKRASLWWGDAISDD